MVLVSQCHDCSLKGIMDYGCTDKQWMPSLTMTKSCCWKLTVFNNFEVWDSAYSLFHHFCYVNLKEETPISMTEVY